MSEAVATSQADVDPGVLRDLAGLKDFWARWDALLDKYKREYLARPK